MKRILLSLLFSGIFFIGSAQDVTIKKGKILFDKKEVASVDGKKRVYTFSNLENKPIFSIEYRSELFPYGKNKIWYTITNLTTNEKNDFETKSTSFSLFNLEKMIVKTFSEGEYKILTENGINTDIVNELISNNKRDILDEFNREIEEYNKNLKNYLQLVQDNGIYFDNKGNIYKADKEIGKITMFAENNFRTYILKENNDYTVGNWWGGEFKLGDKVLFLKETENPLLDSNTKSIKNNEFFSAIVGFALSNGYTLGNQLKTAVTKNNQDQFNQKLQENKDNSVNLYDVTGYLIDEKGNKIDGKLSINFQTVTQGLKQSNVSSIPENLGKSVYLKSINEKGKEKSTRYKSNSGVKFCTESEDCYLGLKTIGNANNAIGNIMSLSADFSYFYKIVYDQNNYLILEDPESKSLYIKIPNQQKALYLGNSNKDKLQKNFDEYMNCNLNASDYDLTTIDGIKVLFEKYKSTCN